MAALLAVMIAVPLGTLSAVFKDTWVDHLVQGHSRSQVCAVPLVLARHDHHSFCSRSFPGYRRSRFTPFFEDPWKNLSQLIWPALAVGYRLLCGGNAHDALVEYWRCCRRITSVPPAPKVCRNVWSSRRHAMRNALLPVVTVVGLEFAFLIGGLVVTEQVFNLNGIGKLFVQAVARGDYTMIQGLVLLVAVFFVMINFAIDLLYAFLDPRIRYR